VSNTTLKQCPICRTAIQAINVGTMVDFGSVNKIPCAECGDFYADGSVLALVNEGQLDEADRRHVSAWIRDRNRHDEKDIVVRRADVAIVIKNVPRPTPAEKANRMLLLLAKLSGQPGTEVSRDEIRASDVWATSMAELPIYGISLLERKLILQYAQTGKYILSMEGWIEVERLQTERARAGHRAFMAMPFGDSRLDQIVTNFFVPTAKAAGFDLQKLTDGQPAGLIDDQLRVRLRTARFIVADLTAGNQGAYWEAGFAEGLGTPVIYTCEKSVFRSFEKDKRTHFDTNHLVHVLWTEASLANAADDLKAIIRNTLPHEAKLEDN
jgi:hypothetical protein